MEFTLSSRTRGLLIQIREAIFQLKGWEIAGRFTPFAENLPAYPIVVYQEVTTVKARKLADGR